MLLKWGKKSRIIIHFVFEAKGHKRILSFFLSFLLSIHSFEIRASMKKPYKTVVINACISCNSFLHSMYSQILYHRYFNYSSFSLCSTDNGFSMFRLKYRVTDSPWWIAEEEKTEIRNYCWELPRFAFFFFIT